MNVKSRCVCSWTSNFTSCFSIRLHYKFLVILYRTGAQRSQEGPAVFRYLLALPFFWTLAGANQHLCPVSLSSSRTCWRAAAWWRSSGSGYFRRLSRSNLLFSWDKKSCTEGKQAKIRTMDTAGIQAFKNYLTCNVQICYINTLVKWDIYLKL